MEPDLKAIQRIKDDPDKLKVQRAAWYTVSIDQTFFLEKGGRH